MEQKKIMLILMYITIFITSFGFIMYSALVISFSDTYKVSLAEAGIAGSVLCVGQFVMIFFNDFLAEHIEKPVLIGIGIIVHIISMFLIAIAPLFWVLLGAFFINGAAISLLNVVMSAYISDIFGEKRNSYLNTFHGFYGVGSLTGPILPTVIFVLGWNWRVSYLIVGVVSIVLLAVLLQQIRKMKVLAPVQEAVSGKDNPKEAMAFIHLLRNPQIFLICLSALLFMGFDMMISTYMSGYMDLALNASTIAGLTITFYWTGSAAGRFVYPILFARFDTKKYLVTVNFLTAVLLYLGVFSGNKWVMLGLIALVGLLSGVNFPLEIGLACEVYPEKSVAATNAVGIFGSLGGIIFPALGGYFMENAGYTSLLILGSLIVLCIAGVTGLLIYEKKKEVSNV